MLHELPTELLWTILDYLQYEDIDTLLSIGPLAPMVSTYLQKHYRFHFQVASLLRCYETLTSTERQKQDTRYDTAQQILHILCYHVQQCSKFDQRAEFTQLLDILQQLVVQRVLCPSLSQGLERDYASLCLEIRHIYLHTASIRGLHDPKYRRRSTKHPLAPFLPRDYTWIWRQHCALINEWITPKMPLVGTSWITTLLPSLSTSIPSSTSASEHLQELLLRRRKFIFGIQFGWYF
ncbi:uncharacterized protein BX664DRAFT_204745 [Halteromyces radiatus]|uniref:uncharacterized protein n=1 Tax=Halteromyces radiatus TaxID=101107 RepID=UPI0022204794|nr:uncharacterized protein BX664DRAFT_204745 [Halteromyces radiatus]KAI8079897.1 hypothetical protein BX664DRAFT_204745 [Halteromyces radiatus]